MKGKIVFIILLSALLGRESLEAQPLDSLLHWASQDNPGLKARYTGSKAMLERQTQVSQLPEPEFGLNLIALPLPNGTPFPDAQFGLMQMIPWKGTLTTQSGIALAEAKAAYEEAENMALDLSYEVKIAWFELYELVRSQDIIKENLELARSLGRLALTRMESGQGSMADILSVQLRIREMEQQLLKLANASRAPQIRINQLLGRTSYQPIDIRDSLALAQVFVNRDSLLAVVQSNHPGLTALQFEIEASRQMVELNRLEGKPTFTVGLDYGIMSKGAEHLGEDGKDMLMPRAGVRLPIFRERYNARTREESLRQLALKDQQADTYNQLAASLEQAFVELEDARLTWALYQEQAKTVRTAINLLETAFSTNGNRFDELLDSYRMLLEYRMMELSAVVKSHQAKAGVERLTR